MLSMTAGYRRTSSLLLVFVTGQRRLTQYYFIPIMQIDFKKDILLTVSCNVRFKQNFHSDTMQIFSQMKPIATNIYTSSKFCIRNLSSRFNLYIYIYVYIIVCIFCFSGHPRQYSVFLDCWDEHGKLHVPDVSQTIFGAVRQCYGKVRD